MVIYFDQLFRVHSKAVHSVLKGKNQSIFALHTLSISQIFHCFKKYAVSIYMPQQIPMHLYAILEPLIVQSPSKV